MTGRWDRMCHLRFADVHRKPVPDDRANFRVLHRLRIGCFSWPYRQLRMPWRLLPNQISARSECQMCTQRKEQRSNASSQSPQSMDNRRISVCSPAASLKAGLRMVPPLDCRYEGKHSSRRAEGSNRGVPVGWWPIRTELHFRHCFRIAGQPELRNARLGVC
jgi:hypothetical protein